MKIEVSLIRLIYNVLCENLEARDNWMLTIQKVHSLEMMGKGISKKDYYDHFFAEHLSNVHTIKRLWQKVQEDYPALRGVTWEDRQRQGGRFSLDEITLDTTQLTLFTQDELKQFAKIDLPKELDDKSLDNLDI
jgi:hypothetical protein